MAILDRVITRLNGEDADENILNELINTASDRLCIRLGEEDLPSLFDSICVDVVIKMYRRMYYEGINSEGTDGFSTSFVDNVLDEYSSEISSYKETHTSSNGRKINFL